MASLNSDFPRSLVELPERAPPPGGVSVRMQAAPVLSYLREVIEGRLGYSLPSAPFTPGTNGIGVVEAVGTGVYHLRPGRVSSSTHTLPSRSGRQSLPRS